MRKNFKNHTNKIKKKDTNGITLIALVITIVVLLILAGISIGMLLGDNSIINQAGNAKTQTDIAQEKEILEQATVVAMGKSKYGNIEKQYLDSELSKYSEIDGTENVEDGIEVTFKSGRAYIVDAEGNVDTYRIKDTTWQDKVDYVLDENQHTITISKRFPERMHDGSYEGDVVIKKKAIIDGIKYTTKFDDNCNGAFSSYSKMTSFTMEDIDTSNVIDMSNMFSGCTSLESIDLSNFNTSNVTNMKEMFYNCTSLKELNLSTFDTKNVTDMYGMFENVSAKLILNGWKIKSEDIIADKNYAISKLFYGCNSKEIIAKNWDVSTAGNFAGLFYDSSSAKIETLDISGWNFGTGHIAWAFFRGCTSLTTVKGIDEWQLSYFNLNQAPFADICKDCTALGNKLTGGIWNNGTWSNGTFTPST